MLRGYRSTVVAAGLIALGLSGQAQEQAEQPKRKADQEQPAVRLSPFPIPVEVIEDEANAEARERHEAEARQREIDDLVAQERMANATEAMKDYSYLQTWIVAIGTLLVFCTLGVSVWANWAAGRAARAAEYAVEYGRQANKIAMDTRRAWLSVAFEVNWVKIEDRNITLNGTFLIENIGNEYAQNIAIEYESLVFSGGIEERLKTFWMKHRQKTLGMPGGDGESLLPRETLRRNTHLTAGMGRDWRETGYRITPVASVRYAPPHGDRWFVTERSFEIWLRAPGLRTPEGEFFHGTLPSMALGLYEGEDVRVTRLESGETR